MVIADDRVETLIDAIAEGRAMWTSVRDALSILLGGSLGEICYGVIGGLLSRTPVMSAHQLGLVALVGAQLGQTMAAGGHSPSCSPRGPHRSWR
ncbi:MAG: hypothetical protein ACRDYA_06980 [Egibacteraceae bacterium]